MDLKKFIWFCLILVLCFHQGTSIWCYRCTSATPGCAEDFNWRGIGFLGASCPETDDICVKITERKGVSSIITRDCLSTIRPYRTDIPADHYEGCRNASKDVRLAHYVSNPIKEYDVRRDLYSDVEFCFCFLDHRCNTGEVVKNSIPILIISIISLFTSSF